MIQNGEAVWCFDCNYVQSYESTKRGNITDLRDSMRGLQEDMQELKEDRNTLVRNIHMLACTSKEIAKNG